MRAFTIKIFIFLAVSSRFDEPKIYFSVASRDPPNVTLHLYLNIVNFQQELLDVSFNLHYFHVVGFGKKSKATLKK